MSKSVASRWKVTEREVLRKIKMEALERPRHIRKYTLNENYQNATPVQIAVNFDKATNTLVSTWTTSWWLSNGGLLPVFRYSNTIVGNDCDGIRSTLFGLSSSRRDSQTLTSTTYYQQWFWILIRVRDREKPLLFPECSENWSTEELLCEGIHTINRTPL